MFSRFFFGQYCKWRAISAICTTPRFNQPLFATSTHSNFYVNYHQYTNNNYFQSWFLLCPVLVSAVKNKNDDNDDESKTERSLCAIQQSMDNDHAFDDPETIKNLRMAQKYISDSEGFEWNEHYKYVMGIIVGLANQNIIFNTHNFSQHFKSVPGCPAWGKISNNVYTNILGGTNEHWVSLMPSYKCPKKYLHVMYEDVNTLRPWWKCWKAVCQGLNFEFVNPLDMEFGLYHKSNNFGSKTKYSDKNNKKRTFQFVGSNLKSNGTSLPPPYKKRKLSTMQVSTTNSASLPITNTNLISTIQSMVNQNMMNTYNNNYNKMTPITTNTTINHNIMDENYNNKNKMAFISTNNMNSNNMNTNNKNNDLVSGVSSKHLIPAMNMQMIDTINANIDPKEISKQLVPQHKKRRNKTQKNKNKKDKRKTKTNPIIDFQNTLEIVNNAGIAGLQILNMKQSITLAAGIMMNQKNQTNPPTPTTIQNIKYVVHTAFGIEKCKIYMSGSLTYNQYELPKNEKEYIVNTALKGNDTKVTEMIKSTLTNEDIIKYFKQLMVEANKQKKKTKKTKKTKNKKTRAYKNEENDKKQSTEKEEDDEDDDITTNASGTTASVTTIFAKLTIEERQAMLQLLKNENDEC